MYVFEGSGKLTRTIMGGEQVHLDSAMDMLSIGYVHPTMLILFCVWAVGRGSGAIAGEIDRLPEQPQLIITWTPIVSDTRVIDLTARGTIDLALTRAWITVGEVR